MPVSATHGGGSPFPGGTGGEAKREQPGGHPPERARSRPGRTAARRATRGVAADDQLLTGTIGTWLPTS